MNMSVYEYHYLKTASLTVGLSLGMGIKFTNNILTVYALEDFQYYGVMEEAYRVLHAGSESSLRHTSR